LVDWVLLTFAGGIFSTLICAVFFYDNGRKKGYQQGLQVPNMITPSMSDITIKGKYTISRKDTKTIAEILREPLNVKGYSVYYVPNVIHINNKLEPEEARKKRNIWIN
jgi:hypothetical protein